MSECSRTFNFDTVDHMLAEAIEDNAEAMKDTPGVVGNVAILGYQAEEFLRERFEEVL